MLPTGGIYAAKKRKKPVQKSPLTPPSDGTLTNPSKRHRARLNQELGALTSLLPFPEEVRVRLDKLSILRLLVGYLKVKGFFSASLPKTRSRTGDGVSAENIQIHGVSCSEGELLLQALNGFVLAVTCDGFIFYASPTIQDYLGFHQSDIIHQSVFELIHTDDRDIFRCQLDWAMNNPETHQQGAPHSDIASSNHSPLNFSAIYDLQHLSSELERSFVCRFRCLRDCSSSGFLALSIQGRLQVLHGLSRRGPDGSALPPQLALFAVASPLQPPAILELRTKTFLFQTKHKLDFTPLACDSRGKVVLGYTELELCVRGTGYQFIHTADMMYCADNHMRMMKTGESGLTIFRLLTKLTGWIWVQANARLVYKGGRPDCIIARQKAISDEEGEEHLRSRALQLPFSFATGEAVLYESSFLEPPSMGPRDQRGRKGKPLDPNTLFDGILQQGESVYVSQAAPVFPNPSGGATSEPGGAQEVDSLISVLGNLLDIEESAEGSGRQGWEEPLRMGSPLTSNFQLSSEVTAIVNKLLFTGADAGILLNRAGMAFSHQDQSHHSTTSHLLGSQDPEVTHSILPDLDSLEPLSNLSNVMPPPNKSNRPHPAFCPSVSEVTCSQTDPVIDREWTQQHRLPPTDYVQQQQNQHLLFQNQHQQPIPCPPNLHILPPNAPYQVPSLQNHQPISQKQYPTPQNEYHNHQPTSQNQFHKHQPISQNQYYQSSLDQYKNNQPILQSQYHLNPQLQPTQEHCTAVQPQYYPDNMHPDPALQYQHTTSQLQSYPSHPTPISQFQSQELPAGLQNHHSPHQFPSLLHFQSTSPCAVKSLTSMPGGGPGCQPVPILDQLTTETSLYSPCNYSQCSLQTLTRAEFLATESQEQKLCLGTAQPQHVEWHGQNLVVPPVLLPSLTGSDAPDPQLSFPYVSLTDGSTPTATCNSR